MRIHLLLATAAAIAYASNLSFHVGGDATTHVFTAASWVTQGNGDLEEYLGQAPFSSEQTVGAHVYSVYPPGTAMLAVIPIWLALSVGIRVASPEFLAVFGKIFGVASVGLSVAFVYLACARIGRPTSAVLATVVYAFATSVWAVSSQQIWEHGPAHLFVALGTYLLTRRDRSSARAGFAYGIATLIRSQEAIVAAFGAVTAWRRRELVRYIAWGLPAAIFLFVYNIVLFGELRQSYPSNGVPLTFPPPGWLGLLVAPSRGIFIYSPVLLFAVAGFVHAWRRPSTDSAVFVRDASIAVIAVYALYASIGYWWGGWTFGDRYMSDVAPLFALGLTFAVEAGALRSLVARLIFALALAWSVLLQFAAAGWFYELWNGYHWELDIDVATYRVWDWSDTEWAFVLRHMVFDPGIGLVPALLGAILAALLVQRAWVSARRIEERASPAEAA